mmetsp:Transcript_6388/g.11060  ORF Transcript_6388/g.11060 Transcript_6388/m.11060 type:complete len:236 (+) Transcript_6388:147-854(+)
MLDTPPTRKNRNSSGASSSACMENSRSRKSTPVMSSVPVVIHTNVRPTMNTSSTGRCVPIVRTVASMCLAPRTSTLPFGNSFPGRWRMLRMAKALRTAAGTALENTARRRPSVAVGSSSGGSNATTSAACTARPTSCDATKKVPETIVMRTATLSEVALPAVALPEVVLSTALVMLASSCFSGLLEPLDRLELGSLAFALCRSGWFQINRVMYPLITDFSQNIATAVVTARTSMR